MLLKPGSIFITVGFNGYMLLNCLHIAMAMTFIPVIKYRYNIITATTMYTSKNIRKGIKVAENRGLNLENKEREGRKQRNREL